MADNVNKKIHNINFDDGFQEVSINSDTARMIRWNPNDVNFVDRFIDFQQWVETEFRKKIADLGITKSKSFDDYESGTLTALGEEVNQALNKCFGSDVATPAFGGINPISPVRNGNLLFINFLEALFPMIENSIKDYDKAREKYTKAAKKVAPSATHPAFKKP